MEKIIAVSDVELSYRQRGRIFSRKKHQVYNGLSFELYKGETLGIIGGNGAGKSSLLKLLAGIYKPDKGRVDNNSKKDVTAFIECRI
jgi:lipopolysaccharide transport system ATP-binding protein